MRTSDSLELVIRPRSMARFLTIVAALLVMVHVAASAVIVRHGFDPAVVRAMGRFRLDEERSIPTVFSFVLLLLSSLLLTAIGVVTRREKTKEAWKWFVLAAVFLFLSFDEILGLHELLDRKLMYRFSRTRSPLRLSWGVPYAIALSILVAWLWGFFRRLPRRTRTLFAISAIVYISGALAVDLIAGPILELYEKRFLGWFATTLEETLEMAGVITFIYAVAVHIEREFPGHRLFFSSG